jgi:hypothetical protein
LTAHPNGVENFHAAWRRSDEAFCPKLCENARDHFSNRTHTVREILLTDQRYELAARFRARYREVKEMACDALADRCKRVSGELFEDIVQSMNRFFRERPRHRCIAPRRSLDSIEIEEKDGGDCYGLHEDRSGPANERRHAEQITRPYIPHGDLAAVTGMHVDAKQTLQDDGQPLSVRFGVHGMARREFDDPPAVDQRFDCSNRNGRPTSASQQINDVHGCALAARLTWRARHPIRLERNILHLIANTVNGR